MAVVDPSSTEQAVSVFHCWSSMFFCLEAMKANKTPRCLQSACECEKTRFADTSADSWAFFPFSEAQVIENQSITKWLLR